MRLHLSLFDQPIEITKDELPFLTRKERYQIYALNKSGHTQSEIAYIIDRSVSTINRELARSCWSRGYRSRWHLWHLSAQMQNRTSATVLGLPRFHPSPETRFTYTLRCTKCT